MNLADRMRHHDVPGVSIAVISSGRIEWARGFGVKDTTTNQPVTSDTLFQAGSISKPVSAAAALHLVQEGSLNLDENVNARLKSWKVPDNEHTQKKKVTLREQRRIRPRQGQADKGPLAYISGNGGRWVVDHPL
jgi:CubicO group peptidase (beta-lactamase class C family)